MLLYLHFPSEEQQIMCVWKLPYFFLFPPLLIFPIAHCFKLTLLYFGYVSIVCIVTTKTE